MTLFVEDLASAVSDPFKANNNKESLALRRPVLLPSNDARFLAKRFSNLV